MIEITDVAYGAGLLDGEGYIGIQPYSAKGYGNYSPRVAIANTSLEIMEWLVQNFGGGYSIWDDRKHQRKRTYKWSIGSNISIKEFLEALQPFVKVKREQLEIMLLFVGFGVGIGNHDNSLLLAAREDLYWDMKLLNNNGKRE